MPLTPEDVSNKRFTPVRLREGYDMGEVDQFLDEVEAELARLNKENDDLRVKLEAAQSGAAQASPVAAPVEAAPVVAPTPEPVVAAPAAPARQEIETIRVETVPDASNAAARLLEIATRNADELVEDAKNEADKIIGEARTKSERLAAESKSKADQVENDARTRATMLDAETAERRTQIFGDLEKERDKLTVEVENLRSFEREYRSRLRSYFTQQLEALGSASETPAPSQEAPAPKRLRSILGEDEG
ncbi:DivIVA domain-containing protein [Nocardioides sp. R-C-SC26]|uniref:DivIVA domain-containing protein n=1 Tax=Nocardioides sp. R-C-SC26 TaxID=2870414 RepID=UPI001E2C285F|nr:DivIVA domain-containing protein [Nocardioides sp. R-C-SC26]